MFTLQILVITGIPLALLFWALYAERKRNKRNGVLGLEHSLTVFKYTMYKERIKHKEAKYQAKYDVLKSIEGSSNDS